MAPATASQLMVKRPPASDAFTPVGPGGGSVGVPTTCTSQEVAVSTVRVPLFAHHAVPVRVAHVLISRVATSDRRNAVRTGLRAGDAAVPVVVPQG